MGPDAQSGLLSLHLHHSTIHHLCISSLVSGLSDGNAKKRLSMIQRLVWLWITGAICSIPMGSMEALTSLPPLDLVVQGEARSAVHWLGSLEFWSYLHCI